MESIGITYHLVLVTVVVDGSSLRITLN